MVTLADELRDVLSKENAGSLGALLHKGWLYKKNLQAGSQMKI